MMETARDLNMETDEMQLVVLALRGVGKRIVEVAQTHKPLFAGGTFPHGQGSVRASLYQSPHLAGLPRQEDYPLHAVCRKDTLQGFRLGETFGRKLYALKYIINSMCRIILLISFRKINYNHIFAGKIFPNGYLE